MGNENYEGFDLERLQSLSEAFAREDADLWRGVDMKIWQDKACLKVDDIKGKVIFSTIGHDENNQHYKAWMSSDLASENQQKSGLYRYFMPATFASADEYGFTTDPEEFKKEMEDMAKYFNCQIKEEKINHK